MYTLTTSYMNNSLSVQAYIQVANAMVATITGFIDSKFSDIYSGIRSFIHSFRLLL